MIELLVQLSLLSSIHCPPVFTWIRFCANSGQYAFVGQCPFHAFIISQRPAQISALPQQLQPGVACRRCTQQMKKIIALTSRGVLPEMEGARRLYRYLCLQSHLPYHIIAMSFYDGNGAPPTCPYCISLVPLGKWRLDGSVLPLYTQCILILLLWRFTTRDDLFLFLIAGWTLCHGWKTGLPTPWSSQRAWYFFFCIHVQFCSIP